MKRHVHYTVEQVVDPQPISSHLFFTQLSPSHPIISISVSEKLGPLEKVIMKPLSYLNSNHYPLLSNIQCPNSPICLRHYFHFLQPVCVNQDPNQVHKCTVHLVDRL